MSAIFWAEGSPCRFGQRNGEQAVCQSGISRSPYRFGQRNGEQAVCQSGIRESHFSEMKCFHMWKTERKTRMFRRLGRKKLFVIPLAFLLLALCLSAVMLRSASAAASTLAQAGVLSG